MGTDPPAVMPRWIPPAFALALVTGCVASSAPPSANDAAERRSSSATSTPRPEVGAPVGDVACRGKAPSAPESIQIISPNQPVPDFDVATTECRSLDSDSLIGEKPLVLVFFSSWCGVCDKKMPVIRQAQEELAGEATFVAVAVDDADTWNEVAPFLQRHDIRMPVVRGDWFQDFSTGFNPFGSIPVVLVIGRDGMILDLQLGYSPFDANRLVGAVELDRRRHGPLGQGASRKETTTDDGT